MSVSDMKHGTRFELVLDASDGSAMATYRASVHRPEKTFSATVEITPTTARIVSGGEGLEPALAAQLIALAKTLGKRAEEASWPRRINRWRQPGVR
jgi:hypothetical protein